MAVMWDGRNAQTETGPKEEDPSPQRLVKAVYIVCASAKRASVKERLWN